jgi:hypothetical protein
MYEFLRGPLVWVAFAVFVLGSGYKLVSMALLARREKSVFPTYSARYGLRSLAHWLIPFRSRNTRLNPGFTAVSFAFHLCLLVTPLLVMGHAVLWQESWGISWWSLPPLVADLMTLVVFLGSLFFIVRRLVAPEVRHVTTWREHAIIVLVAAPYVTAFIAHHQWLDYDTLIVLHIVTGVLWLLAIPITWLTHMLWFVFTRAYMGSEFGSVRNSRDW